uniref:Uncharacterized protein n=1 Tax=Anopheles quadriannulatus TaxID=34691 RepID=A0A182XS15_ANOQN
MSVCAHCRKRADDPRHQIADTLLQLPADVHERLVAVLLLLLVAHRAHVGDQAEGEAGHTAVPGRNDLVHGRHTDRVHAEQRHQPTLGHGFEVGTADTTVHTLTQHTLQPGHMGGRLFGRLQQGRFVRFGHAEKPWPEALIVRAEQRTVASEAHQIDVILNEHDVADAVAAVDGTGRIRSDQVRTADQAHHTHRHGTLRQRVSLVVVEASLHAEHGHTGQIAKHQPSQMASHGRDGEVRDRLVVEAVHIGQLLGQRAQAGPADDANLRA